VPSPLNTNTKFTNTYYNIPILRNEGDIAELIPMVERIDGKTIKYKAKDVVEACKSIELLTIAVPRLYPLYICSSYAY